MTNRNDLNDLMDEATNEDASKERYRRLQETIEKYGSTIVEENGQWSMKLGIEQNIDDILPITQMEIDWRMNRSLKKP